MNQDLPDVHAAFRKGGGARDQIAYIPWIMEHATEFKTKKKQNKKKKLILNHSLCQKL